MASTIPPSRPDGCDQRLDADKIHHSGQIVSKDVQCHLGCDPRQPLHQEVRRAHSGLDRAEGMLDRFTPLAHRLRVLVEPLLYCLK